MTQYTRTLSRVVTSATLPTWRQAITSPNKLYKVAGDPAADMNGTIVWPSGSQPAHWGSAYSVHTGFGGAVLAEDVGVYGTLVYCGTGEDTFGTQLTSIPLSSSALAWQMYQQPYYALSQAEAVAQDGDWYYSLSAEAAASAANPGAAMEAPTGVYILSSWNKSFPVTLRTQGWVQYRKAKQTLGKNQPIRLRYNTPTFIPASMTGTGAGALLAFDDNFAGPLRGNSGLPDNFSQVFNAGNTYNPGDYAQDLMPNGDLAVRFRAMNTSTKVWTTLSPLHRPVAGAEITRGNPYVDRTSKRVYYELGNKSVYLDLSAGLAGATVSTPATFTVAGGATIQADIGSASGATEGHPSGRRLVFLKWGLDGSNPTDGSKFILYDHDTLTVYLLDFSSIGFSLRDTSAQILDFGFGYNPNALPYGKLYVTYRLRFTSTYYLACFPLPADPTNVANYVGSFAPSKIVLTAAPGTTLETSSVYQNPFGRMRCYHPGLDVIFWPHDTQVMAFRPSI